jgi:2-dehydro-3-deoxygluconokinase
MKLRALDLVCFGEPLMEFAEVVRNGETVWLPGFGGDASNVAIAAARQGARVAMLTALGDDPFGARFLDLWDRECIDRASVTIEPGGATGIYFITYGPNGHDFAYRRAGSAASRLGPDDLPRDIIASARALHVSGITQAISDSSCAAVFAAIAHARESGTRVSFDTNLRLKLWPLERARPAILAAAAQADLVRPGLDDARLLTGLSDPDAIADYFLRQGAGIIAMTLGADGCLVATGERRLRLPPFAVTAVDASGAGDTFSGAFLAEWLQHGDPFAAARYANVAAALSTLGHGAVAPIPARAQVEAALRELAPA